MASTSNFFDVVLFLLPSLVTSPSFISISSLFLELWQLSFVMDWQEIRKSEKPPSKFFPISGDWGNLWIPNLARVSLVECDWMLLNSSVTAFTVFELLRENQLGGKITLSPRLGLNHVCYARVGIFNSPIKHTSPNVRYFCDVNLWIFLTK